jgi:hypothetical protein
VPLPDGDIVSQYIFRGIRVKDFDITRSMFPANFQSYSMTTTGVYSVLKHYAAMHKESQQNTVVITLMDYDFNIQQLAQPIALFDFLHSSITDIEKELIFPPFCDFSLKTFELSDIKNEFYREVLGARMLKFARARKTDTDIKLLWVTAVNCLPLYETLQEQFTQPEEIINLENQYFEIDVHTKTEVFKDIEFWHDHFPQESHPCIRLFSTQEEDIMHHEPLTEQDIDIMIRDFMQHQLKSYELYQRNEVKLGKSVSYEQYMNAFHIFDDVMKRSQLEGTEYDYIATPNEIRTSLNMYHFYTKIKIYINQVQAPELKLSRYQVKLYFFSYFFNETERQRYSGKLMNQDDWKKSQKYCLEWQNKILNTEKSTLKINDCYSVPLIDSHQNRYVCEYEDHTYSLNTDFPCTRQNQAKPIWSEYGRFCKLSSTSQK